MASTKLAFDNANHPHCVALFERRIFANFPFSPTSPVEVTMGSSRALLEPVNPDSVEELPVSSRSALQTLNLQRDTRSHPAETALGEVYVLKVNALEDWTLAGTQTIQLMFPQRDLACRVDIDRPIIVDVEPNSGGLFFQTYFASHRAEAVLVVQFFHRESRQTEIRTINSKLEYLGGQTKDGYQKVVLPLPRWTGRVEISIAVEYQSYVDAGGGVEPYVFLADTHVTRQRVQAKSKATPSLVLGSSMPESGVWLSALLPAMPTPGSTIQLRYDHHCEALALGPAAEIAVDPQYGHTLIIQSAAQAVVSLYIDGRFDRQINVEPGGNAIRVANVHLDGKTHHISLRDKSGSLTYWENFVLLPANLTPADIMQRESAAPFPASIFVQTPRRYASLRALFADAGPSTDFAQLSHALNTVEAGYDKVRLRPLRFPQVENPDVSIIIPAHNKVAVTYLALCSLLVAPNKASFEVIVVDDGSTDETVIRQRDLGV
jgi:hypothetical protein